MRLTTVTAPDMQTAMEHIRESMGEDAVILSSKPTSAGNGEIQVTVAIEEAEETFDPPPYTNGATAHSPHASNDNSALLEELQAILEFHSTPVALLDSLMQTAQHLNFERDITPEGITRGMAKLLSAAFRFSPLPLRQPDFAMMLIGPPGVGKTMAIAKLAAQMTAAGITPTVISTDNSRAGGIEQLSAFTDIMGLELQVADSPAALRRCLKNNPEQQPILIDSAGANPYDAEQLDELQQFVSQAITVEPVLAVPAGLDSGEACHIAQQFAPLGVTRLLISRADTARRYGSLLAAAHHAELDLCNISGSPKVVEAVAELDAHHAAHLLTQDV